MKEIKIGNEVEIIAGSNKGKKGIITLIDGDWMPYLVEFEGEGTPLKYWFGIEHLKLISTIKFSYIYEKI